MPKHIEKYINNFIAILMSVVAFLAIRTLNQIDESMRSATLSIQELNQTVARVVADISYQKQSLDEQRVEINDHEIRIRGLEKNK
jgi:cell shape-determining protein MreC